MMGFSIVGIILTIVFVVIYISRLASLRKKLKEDVRNKDLDKMSKLISNRVSEEGMSSVNFLQATKIYDTRFRGKITDSFYWSKFNDLFSNEDKRMPAAVTEMRFELPRGSLTDFKRLYGFSLTKINSGLINFEIKDELIYVDLNGKNRIVVDMRNKEIRRGNSVIATLDYPSIYVKGIVSIYANIKFKTEKFARVLMTRNYLNSLLSLIPNHRVKIASLDEGLSIEEFLGVFGVLLFFKIKNSFDPK